MNYFLDTEFISMSDYFALLDPPGAILAMVNNDGRGW